MLAMSDLPGVFLRELRLRLRLALREVQQLSLEIAKAERNKRFYVSATRLSEIENSLKVPSQFKVFTLSVVYGVSFYELLARFGVDPDQTHRHRREIKMLATRPVSSELLGWETKVAIPIKLDPSFKWERTHLINRAVALWGEIPAAFLLNCNPRQHMYAYIGIEDDTMGPLLRPGSLVMIDNRVRHVKNHAPKNEYERPIYLIELRDGYLCSWCYVSGSEITIVPHPTSTAPVRRFSLSTEAEVIGQVVAVAMRLVPPTLSSRELDVTPPVHS